MTHKITKLLSGCQTGSDRSAIDVAISLGIPYGGSIPKGKLAEDGPIDLNKYDYLTELKTKSYSARTEKNVLDASATLIFTYTKMGAGSALTMRLAEKHHKPYLHVNLEKKTDEDAIEMVRKWLDEMKPTVLNVAGSRESTCPGIYNRVFHILKTVLESSNG